MAKKKKEDKDKTFKIFRTMEKTMSDIEKAIENAGLSSPDEIHKFINKMNFKDFTPPEPRTPREKAQELIYQAWETNDKNEEIKLARKALEISEDCVDAYVILGNYTEDTKKAGEIYKKGMQAGEKTLGKEYFKKNKGRFWGFTRTRPYMRAKLSYAQCLWLLKKREEAIEELFDMLLLNPNDNQGIRYLLLNWLITEGKDDKAWNLLKKYKENSTQWRYNRALLTFRKKGKCAISNMLLKRAIASNKYVAEILTGKRKIPKELPYGYSPGSIEEANVYINKALSAWNYSDGALKWIYDNYKESKFK